MNIGYNIDIPGLFGKIGAGEVVSEPVPLAGGHLHKMFGVKTAFGRYAVKAINPQVIIRPAAKKNYADSEYIARRASSFINSVPALLFYGQALQEHGGQYYLIYDFVGGVSLFSGDIGAERCSAVGEALAELHAHTADFTLERPGDDGANTGFSDWNFYLEEGVKSGAEWVPLFREEFYDICRRSRLLAEAEETLKENDVISHCDLDPKNVLWLPQDKNPILIDWEAAGYTNSAFDMLETALYWSKMENGELRRDYFKAFCSAYLKRAPLPRGTLWEAAAVRSCYSILGWLEYSLRRSLGIECADDAERELGTSHVFGSIARIISGEKNMPLILRLIRETEDEIMRASTSG